jgi:hypothetical protein
LLIDKVSIVKQGTNTMSTQKSSKFHLCFLKRLPKQATFAIALLGMSLPLYTLSFGQRALAAHHHNYKQDNDYPISEVRPAQTTEQYTGRTIATGRHPKADERHIRADLIRQDFSDCVNSNVTRESGQVGGFVDVEQDEDQLELKIALQHGTPNTTYNIFLKCKQQIGTLTTNSRGVGRAEFRIQKNLVSSSVFAFDVYPDGAPTGNKYQSVQVRLSD